ncbi:lipopolysaccharide biosynthesis protein [Thiorhodovibrio winogradskyi]
MQFAVTMVLARLLTPADFGLLAMLLVFIGFAAVLVEGGLGTALVQKQVTNANDETTVFLINLGVAFALAGLLWLMAPVIAMFYNQLLLIPLLQAMLWLLPLGALVTVPNALLSQRLEFRKRAMAELVASTGSALLALWLAWRGWGVWSLVWQALTGAVLRAALLWWVSGWRPQGRFNGAAFAELFRFAGPLLLANAMNVASVRLQALMIGKLFDARALGFYGLAQDTQQAPAQFMNALINRVGLPVFSKVAREQPGQMAGALRLALRLSMFVFAPCMGGIAVLASPLVLVLYGPQWAEVAPILSILALAAIFWPLHVLNLAALSALGRADLVLRMEIIKALTMIPLVLVASFFGVIMVAWAVLGSSLVCVVINTWHSRRLLGCGLSTQIRDLLPGFLLTLAAVCMSGLVAGWVEQRLLSLGMAIGVAMFIYLGGATVLRLRAWGDLLKFINTLCGVHSPTSGASLT